MSPDAPERRDLEQLRKDGPGNDGRRSLAARRGRDRGALLNRENRSFTTGLTPSLTTHVRIGLLGALTIVTPVLMKRAPTGGRPLWKPWRTPG